jgi:hypothetical protein
MIPGVHDMPLLKHTRTTLLLGACATVATLTACGGSASTTTTTSPTAVGAATTSSGAGSTPAAVAGPTLKDGWVKSAPTGMTAIFGTLDNPTDQVITVVSGASPVASMVELHEVAMVGGAMKMRPKAGGFVIPAHGSHELTPGGDHIMLMGLKQAVKAGDPVTATLTVTGGATVTVSAIGKDFAAGNETYAPSGSGMSMPAGTSASGS